MLKKFKCYMCDGKGGRAYYSDQHGDFDEECDTCQGSGELEMTQEEWDAMFAPVDPADKAEEESERNREAATERAFYQAGYGEIPF